MHRPLNLFVALLLAASVVHAQVPTPVGADFQVNSYTTAAQYESAIMVDPSGSFVIVWHGYGSAGTDTSGTSIQMRRFASDGSPAGADFQVNEYTTGYQESPDIARSASGDFVIVWQSFDSSAPIESLIQARRFASDGSSLGASFQVASYVTGSKRTPRIDSASAGGFVVAWEQGDSPGDDADSASIQARRFASDGSSFGPQFQVNAYTTSPQFDPAVAVGASGDFVVVWTTNADPIDTAFTGVAGRKFTSSGSPIGIQFTVNSFTTGYQSTPSVAASGGEFIVSWAETDVLFPPNNQRILGRRFTSDGAPGLEFQVDEGFAGEMFAPNVTAVESGRFSVFWRHSDALGGDPDGSVQGRHFNSGGVPMGGQFQVNTYTTGSQYEPGAAINSHGDLVVAWSSYGSGGDDQDESSIQARRFRSSRDLGDRVWRDLDADGVQDGGEPGVADVAVTLYDPQGAVLDQTMTDADGRYNFRVADGDYYLRFSAPSGMLFNARDVGLDDSIDSDADEDGFTVVFSVAGDDLARDAGLVEIPIPPPPPPSETELTPQIQVNTVEIGIRSIPWPASRGTGEHVIIWRASGAPGDPTSNVEARRFDADGAALGDQFTVNSYTTGFDTYGAVEYGANGDFLIVWAGEGTSGDGVHGRRYGSDGTPYSDPFLIAVDPLAGPPTVASDAEGDFVVVWTSDSDGSSEGVRGRRLASDGSLVGAEFLVNTYTTGRQSTPSVASDAAGNFVVVWNSYGSPGNDADINIEGRRFASDGGSLGDQFQVNTYTTSYQYVPVVAMRPDGRFAVVWSSDGSSGDDTDGGSPQARLFAADGTPETDQFQINAYTTGRQAFPAVDMDAGGEFLVVWESQFSKDDPDSSIQGRRFASDGSPVGGQFLVNEYTTGSQQQAMLAVDDEGEFVIAWTSFTSASGDTHSVQSRILKKVGSNLGNRVWLDLDADGIQDAGEPGESGVGVSLYDASGALAASVVTDAQGEYLFTEIDAGEYSLEFELPPTANAFTHRDAGSDDALDSDVDVDGTTALFSLGLSDLSVDAGLISTRIGDRVWLDADFDGVQDEGELGAAGVVVELFAPGGVSQGTTVTDAEGGYVFTDLAPGEYYLEMTAPSGLCWTVQDQGDDTLDSDVDPSSSTTAPIDLGSAQSAITWDAGLVAEASIGNRVWLDDGDGVQTDGELGAAGVTVNLYRADNVFVASTQTDVDGNYVFSPGPGEYYLEIVLPDDKAFAPRDQGVDDTLDSDFFGATATTAVFTLNEGEVDATRDAGLLQVIFKGSFETGDLSQWSNSP